MDYVLTAVDALAYLKLKREPTGRVKVAMALWFLAGGAASGLVPDRLMGAEGSRQAVATFLGVMALQFGLLLAARALWRRWTAWRMVPHPVQAEFEEWVDCVAGTDIKTLDCSYLSPELIGQVLDTPTHLFVLNYATAIVVPVHAFESPHKLKAMADYLRKLAAGPYYFDA
jgi:hypothetical protein